MFLTEANYYSKEANQEYLSVSQYKDFCGTMKQRGCEAKAMAKLRGEWVEEMTALSSGDEFHFVIVVPVYRAHQARFKTELFFADKEIIFLEFSALAVQRGRKENLFRITHVFYRSFSFPPGLSRKPF